MGPRERVQTLSARCSNGCGETICFGTDDALTQRASTIVAAPLVIQFGIGTLVGFFHQTRRKHSFQTSVECSGAKLQGAFGMRGDFLHDAVAVQFAIAQCQQNVKHWRA